MKHIRLPSAFCCLFLSFFALDALNPRTAYGAAFLVRDGRPCAEIVVAEDPPRTTRLAAHELQAYIATISGAQLPIVTAPTGAVPVKVYVGASPWTEKLGLSTEGLAFGAYRVVSGGDWLALLGVDTDFTPIDPWPRNHAEWANGKIQAEWNQITGAMWGNPMAGLYKNTTGRWADFGKPKEQRADKSDAIHVWSFDERGSFNAVCGFLTRLGVRWYLPGDLGEVVPALPTIPLPAIDETVRPDFAVRRINVRFAIGSRDRALWAMRLGLRDPFDIEIPHGMSTMTDRKEIMEAHPDWFALYSGNRHVNPEDKNNQLCYSNEELFQETVRYARTLFDHYGIHTVSVMPPDGYTGICQCPLCAGKDTPERDDRGRLSDYVWDFVNRVAREVRKTHPDKMISNCAYGVYTLPPEKIAKLEPNVLVCIVGGRRPMNNKPEQQEATRKLREAWAAKTDNPIMIFENYPLTDRGFYLPAFTPHSLAESINATKGLSMGEDIWLSMGKGLDKDYIGFNHFLIYFTARMWWGGKDKNVDEMLDEYCRLFYGPAEKGVKAFFAYCEANWQEMDQDKKKVDRALALFDAARGRAEPETVYGQRLALMDSYLKSLRNKSALLGKKRGRVPSLRLLDDAAGIVIDGKLDDRYWRECRVCSVTGMRELQTGRRAALGTVIKAGWGGNGNLYVAITCTERPGEPLAIGTQRRDDPALWSGDAVELLLETDARAYYQIAVNPAGAVFDRDWSAGESAGADWDSQAEIAVQVTNDHWTVELCIPVTTDENDPLHKVIGRKPTSSLPWHINVCRHRVRDNGTEVTAFSPTGADTVHVPAKFGQFFDGRSHTFEAHESPEDFLDAQRAAGELGRQGKHAEAIAAYSALAERDITDLQKSHVLESAAELARKLRQPDLVAELCQRIPIDAVAKTVRMQNFLDARKAPELIAAFGTEEIAAWPFWKQGEGYFARGVAWSATGEGARAEADLTNALATASEDMERVSILQAVAENRRTNLADDAGALAAYLEIVNGSRAKGSAAYLGAVQRAARLLSQAGRHAEAEVVMAKVEIATLSGSWRTSTLLELAAVLQAAGKNAAAIAACQKVLEDANTEPQQRKKAEELIAALSGK